MSKANIMNERWCRGLALIAIIAFAASAGLVRAQPFAAPTPVSGPTGIFTVRGCGGLRKGELKFSYPVEVRTENLPSKLTGRDMPYRIVLPDGYPDPANISKRFPVVYLLHGLTGHYNNWTDKTDLGRYAPSLIIVTPEGEDGWYTDSATKPNDKFESYIIKELIPEIDRKFRTVANRQHRAIAGLSMGGYGAIKFGLKYPEMFSLAGSFSGAIGAADITEKKFPGAIGKSIDAIFGTADGEIRKANDPFHIARQATTEYIKTLPFLYLDCGTEDFLFQSNRDFVSSLVEKKIPHEYRQLPGGHNWKYWDTQVEEFLQVASKRMGASPAGRK